MVGLAVKHRQRKRRRRRPRGREAGSGRREGEMQRGRDEEVGGGRGLKFCWGEGVISYAIVIESGPSDHEIDCP